MEQKLLELILAFERESAEMLREFLQRAGFETLHEARDAKIPRTGYIPGRPRLTYRFHGIGLLLRIGGRRVDMDFGYDGRTGGFDSWRLWLFARDRVAHFPEFQDEEAIKASLTKARAAGEIGRLHLDRADWLEYRLVDGVRVGRRSCSITLLHL